MAFAVICKSCQARFLLNDDLLRRKVAGRVVTVRCRQCHATIEVDASDVDPESVPEAAPEPPPPPALGKIRAPRPAPAPPRPTAKSTLMGIGAPRAAGATELVALSPGLLDVKPAPASPAGPEGFPEPPPPPGSVEVLDAGDWDEIQSTPSDAKDEGVPESLDDFAEELPPSLPPEEEMPSSTGTPSLKALAHHEQTPKQPRVDEFLANMTAAMNGGTMPIAPTIDVSGLASAPVAQQQAPTIDVAELNEPKPAPLRDPVRGAQTLPLFSTTDTEEAEATAPAAKAPKAPPKAPAAKAAKPDLATASPDGSLSPSTLDPRPPESEKPADSPRERRNVVAPATKSVPPAPASPKTSGLAVPLLLALAAAAGFFIWKRSSSQAPEPVARPEPAAERVPATTPPPTPVATAVAAEPAAPATTPAEDLTFETAPDKPAALADAVAATKPAAAAIAAAPADAPAKPVTEAPAPAAPKEEPKPEPAAPTPPAEPAGPFDRAAAAAALTNAAGQASACRKEGDPSGVASVTITFAPSGRVTSANIGGPPFAGTPTGGCIASTLRKAKVPPFEGDRVTVSKTVVIQ